LAIVEDKMMDRTLLTRRLMLGLFLSALPMAVRAQGSLLEQGKGLLGGIGGGLPGGGSSGGAKAGSSLSEGEVGSGLKEALKLASQHVTGQLGKTDGYFKDPAIQIPLPGVLQKIEGPLKSMGASGMLDNLHLQMNRAAEQAAPKALNIFTDAVSKMSISDAKGILAGPDDAATQYFRRTTSGNLTTAFKPIVDTSLSSVGAVSTFNSVKSQGGSLPLVGNEVKSFDLSDFTVGKALDGLFHYMGVEEASIRTNPAARTTDLLKKVFS
jgi:hypothetical protein